MNTLRIGSKKISLGYVFIFPGILFFLVMMVYPALYVVWSSFFFEGKGLAMEPAWQGFQNYINVFESTAFWKISANTALYAGGCTVFHMGGGLIMALMLNSSLLSTRFKHIFRMLILVPWAVTPSVVAIVSKLFFHASVGPISVILKQLGFAITFDPLGKPDSAMLTCIITNAWKFMPFYFLILLTGLQAVDSGLYEAARLDGANEVKCFWHVTMPQIKNTFLTLTIFDFVINAAYFDITWIMTQGGPMKATETLATLAYKTAFQRYKFGEASAIGVLLFFMSVVFTLSVLKAMKED